MIHETPPGKLVGISAIGWIGLIPDQPITLHEFRTIRADWEDLQRRLPGVPNLMVLPFGFHVQKLDEVAWIAGRIGGVQGWKLLGLFSTEAKAVEACTAENDFVAPLVVDAPPPEGTKEFPGAYFPTVRAKEASA